MAASARSWVSTHLTAELMEHRRTAQGKTEAKGVCTLLRQGHRLLAPRQPLVRIAQDPTAPKRQNCGTSRQHPPHRGTQRRGAAGDRRAPSPAQSACAQRLPLPGRTTSLPKARMRRHEHGRVLGLLRQGQELLTQCVRRLQLGAHVIIIATVHATRGKAGEGLPDVDRAVERTCTSLQLQELRSPSSQSTMRPRRYACPLLAG